MNGHTLNISSMSLDIVSTMECAGHKYHTCAVTDSVTVQIIEYRQALRVVSPDCTIADWLRIHAELHFLTD